ncbi:MAG: dodecin domain-containing protein, partial [Alcaligenaceae bacterium]|nr:dodecin domain-containing protein [Alcaligenaceae bacterium]
MSHTYKQIEIVGSSNTSIEDAVSSAIAKASETVRNIQWFEV